MTSATQIAKTHFASAMAEADEADQGHDAVARALMNLVLETFLATRPVEDVGRELVNLAENLDPDTDYTFMRP